MIQGWARDGLTNAQIAHNMGISRETLNQWEKRFPDISESLKKGKEVVDREVENALLKRALGYRYKEITQEPILNATTGKIELHITKIVEKEIIPDTTAQIFWLKNRKPEEWRDKRQVESKVEVESDGFIEALKGEVNKVFKEGDDFVET